MNNQNYNGQLGRDPGYGQTTGGSALSDCIKGTGPFHKPDAPPSSLRQIAGSNGEQLKTLELKLRDIRGCSMNSSFNEAKDCAPDACGLPSIESSLVETEYTINRLHAIADELLARL